GGRSMSAAVMSRSFTDSTLEIQRSMEIACINRAGNDPAAISSARTSVNTYPAAGLQPIADTNITTQHYIRNTKRIASELGHLLKGAENVVSIRKQQNTPQQSNAAGESV